jgi:hypothetical protein
MIISNMLRGIGYPNLLGTKGYVVVVVVVVMLRGIGLALNHFLLCGTCM